jgi:hypothetical protein
MPSGALPETSVHWICPDTSRIVAHNSGVLVAGIPGTEVTIESFESSSQQPGQAALLIRAIRILSAALESIDQSQVEQAPDH